MPRANDAVAALLNEYAELHLMTGGDQFRARSYEKAARAIAGLAEDVSQVDLRVVPLDSWGAALQYFTGSQAHNVAIREIAVRKKLKLSEYGLFDAVTGEKIVSQTGALLAASPAGPGGEPMVLLHGTELNIAPDGTVDWPAEFLDGFDVCVASVHSNFDQSRPAMTRRFVAACENPYVNIIGHPLTRRIGRRPPVDVDLPELFRACARTGTALEVNAHPNRLDLPSAHIRAARDAGVRFAIDSDAHFTGGLDYLRYGVGTAQRGWLTPDDVINTWPLPRLRAFLRKGR